MPQDLIKANANTVLVYGARILFRHVNAMQAEVEGVREGKDVEYIHRMRVASRRMRAALAIFPDVFEKKVYKAINKDMREVTRALGAARDADVQLEALRKEMPKFPQTRLQPGLRRLELRLRQHRDALQPPVIKAMDDLVNDQVLERILRIAQTFVTEAGDTYLFSPGLYSRGYENTSKRIEELFTYELEIHDPSKVTQLHETRIAAKHLRYSLEAFTELYREPIKPFIEEVKKIQELLGTIHDQDVWIGLIPEFIETERTKIIDFTGNETALRRLIPGLNALLEDRKMIRSETYQQFITVWDQQQTEDVWGKLKKLIAAPIDLEQILTLQAAKLDFNEVHTVQAVESSEATGKRNDSALRKKAVKINPKVPNGRDETTESPEGVSDTSI